MAVDINAVKENAEKSKSWKALSAACQRAVLISYDPAHPGLNELFEEQDWWQFQIDLAQLSIYELEERQVEYAKILRDYLHISAKRGKTPADRQKASAARTQADMVKSLIDVDMERIRSYRAWEEVAFKIMQRTQANKRVGVFGKP